MSARKILFLASNPEGTTRLRLDEEQQEISEGLQRSQNRDLLELKSKWAVSPTSLRRALIDEKPQIVHFCGHGVGKDGILLEDEKGGKSKLASTEALGDLFKFSAERQESKLECVILNACYADEQAKIISQYVDYVVGMNGNISDKAAIQFSIGFYDAIASGESIERAYEMGKIAIKLQNIPEDSIPVLRRKPIAKQYQFSISEKIRDFVGREYVFSAISQFITSNPNGYFEIVGDPGMGKSAILAKYVQNTNCIAHFNVQASCQTAEEFIRNISNQLIHRYQLTNRSIPGDSKQYSAFLGRLLEEATKKNKEPIVIAVDALDEVEEANHETGFNILYLPVYLPENIYFIVTKRRGFTLQFITHAPKYTFNLAQTESQSREDICAYIQLRINRNNELKKRQERDSDFLNKVASNSQNNFMYLVYFLNDLEKGKFTDLNLDSFPVGLEDYYELHWKRMGMTKMPLPMLKLYVIYHLAVSRQPISPKLISEYVKYSILEVAQVLEEWRQFLHLQNIDEEYCYSIYHSSFRDFLYKKEKIKAAGISLQEINKQKVDILWEALFSL
jgi:hypothetical protein